ncbi:hypothetical protein NEHOM01_2099 [Nematocida homosporus]|uniref:uncharacterized protein n=1 Tax=Nematocida homosporus TaxID=1912981 RepID=UPI00222051D2|nr:uncharacterized protein NEHOM01_2099 [Nematocida homosporus]KAI5187332.1 hypothetical protein NEHOM01_2099 [Nematocida homosporus]
MAELNSAARSEFLLEIQKVVATLQAYHNCDLSVEIQERIYEVLEASIVRGPSNIEEFLVLFTSFVRQSGWLIETELKWFKDIFVLFLKSITEPSARLAGYAREALQLLERASAGASGDRLVDLLLVQLEINVLLVETFDNSVKIEEIITLLQEALDLHWVFIGGTAKMYANQVEEAPILKCAIEKRVGKVPNTNQLEVLEGQIPANDRYFLFPQETHLVYGLVSREVECLVLVAKYLVTRSDEESQARAEALAKRILLEEVNGAALLVYSQTIKNRPLARLSLIEYVMQLDDSPCNEQERELLYAQALTAVGSHSSAYTYFQKHNQLNLLIKSLCLAEKKELAVPLLTKKIAEVRNKLENQEVADLALLALMNTKSNREAVTMLRIELGTLLYTLGKLTVDTTVLHEAFSLLKTAKYAKTLCTHLLLEGKIPEAIQVLQQCPFEVVDNETLLLTAVTLMQTEKYQDAERVLKYSYTFNQPDQRIDSALQVVLVQQGKIDELLETLYARVKIYSRHFVKDCNSLFTFGSSFLQFKYAAAAIAAFYQKTNQVAPAWIETMLKSAAKHPEASEELLRVLTPIPTLDVAPYIKQALASEQPIAPEVEYFARKRLIEEAIHKRAYDTAAEAHLQKMKGLSTTINQDRDYLDTVYAFFQSQRPG